MWRPGLAAGGEPGGAARLEGGDGVLALQGEADVVEAPEQAVAAERVDFEARGPAVVELDRLLAEVNSDLAAGAGFGAVHELAHLGVGELDGHHAVLEQVVAEDV